MVYQVSSEHFDFHPVLEASTYWEALEKAKKRGFEARIKCNGVLAATWSPLYGVTTYNRELCK